MKRLFLVCVCLALLFSLAPAVSAAAPKIVDSADLLTDAEEAALETKAQALVDAYQMDVVIVTNWSLGGKSPESYADDYFDYNGYGIGSDHSGVLFLLSMEYRDWWMSTCGDTIYALTDYGIESVFSEISWYLSNDQYYYAFDEYLDQLDYYFEAYIDGSPVDGYYGNYDGPGSYSPGTQDDVVYYDDTDDGPFGILVRVLIALGVGAIAGGIGLSVMKGKMNTAVSQKHATSYMRSGTYKLTGNQNIFLYHRTSRVARAQNTGSGGSRRGGGGGSSIHRGSSGRRHGGGGGKF